MSLLVILLLLPSVLYQLVFILDGSYAPLHRYSWSLVHDGWNVTVLVKSGGSPAHWHRWIWIACGYIVFAFFGIGSDARKMYKKWLVFVGLSKVFQSFFAQEGTENKSSSEFTWFVSVSSKAKMLFTRKGSTASSMLGDSL
jgi:pheromone a factor receptor